MFLGIFSNKIFGSFLTEITKRILYDSTKGISAGNSEGFSRIFKGFPGGTSVLEKFTKNFSKKLKGKIVHLASYLNIYLELLEEPSKIVREEEEY